MMTNMAFKTLLACLCLTSVDALSVVTTSRVTRMPTATPVGARWVPPVAASGSPTMNRMAALHASSSDNQLEEENDRKSQNWLRSRARRFAKKTRHWMQQVRAWKNSGKIRTTLAAAVFALSIFFSAGPAVAPPSPITTQPTMVAVERQVPSETLSFATMENTQPEFTEIRGGGERRAAKQATKQAKQAPKKKSNVEEAVVTASISTSRTFKDAIDELAKYMQGPKSDTLLLLLATALITPLCQRLGTSPILGFLASGMLLGPNGWGLISGIHTTETLAELGIVFFLFEMGIELSFERLLSMKRDVFGLGLSQFSVTALAVALVGKFAGLPTNAVVVLGGGIALSSSAFVLQLLKDKNQLATRFGRASFGVLLFQDLAVVPLLVVTPILAGGGEGLASALGSAVLKAGMALGSIALAGRYVVNPMFKLVAGAQSQEAFLGVILLTVLSMSFMTEGLGLSNTLGAFLAGVLLSETKYRYQIEADIAPFRGVLLGLFFVTVGFEIDVGLILSNLPLVSSIVLGIIAIKAVTTTLLSLAFGLSLSVSQRTGLMLSQGGEFAFVAFGLARTLGILDKPTTKLMLTSVSLTMALTPALASLGGKIAKKLEEQSDFSHYLGQDRDANEIKESDDFAVVIGYGAVGKVVCELMDRKLIKYVGIDNDPKKVIQARNSGLPVFYGDIGRQEVAHAFNVGKAKSVIVCISDKAQANRAVIALRRWYPEVKIFCRASDKDHAYRLQSTLDVAAMVPILPEDNLLLTLPFGGAVLKAMGAPPEEVNAILEAKRKEVLSGKGLRENEEDMALIQLGIEPAPGPKKPMQKFDSVDADVLSKEKEEEKLQEQIVPEEVNRPSTTAAAEYIENAKAKSPFVAEVIGAACPDSVAKENAPEVEVEIIVEKSSILANGAGNLTDAAEGGDE